MTQAKPPTFRVALGLRLRALREEKKLHVEAVAAIARHWGLPWRRSVVTQLEHGRRRLWAEEWFVLPAIYSAVLGGTDHPLSWKDLLPENGLVTLTREVDCATEGLKGLVEEKGIMKPEIKDSFLWSKRSQVIHDLQAGEALGRRLWRPGNVPTAILEAAIGSQHEETVIKAAKALRVSPLEIGVASFRLWSKPLTAERDARVTQAMGETSPPPARLKALRGHVTRELRAILRVTLQQSTPHKKTEKRSTKKGGKRGT